MMTENKTSESSHHLEVRDQFCDKGKPVGMNPCLANRQCKHRLQLRSLQKKMAVANKKLADFDALKEENEFLSNRNKELVSHLDSFMSQHGSAQSSIGENPHSINPYTHILKLEDKVRSLQLELGLHLAKGDCTQYLVHEEKSEITELNNFQEKIETNHSSSNTPKADLFWGANDVSLNKVSLEVPKQDVIKSNTDNPKGRLQSDSKNTLWQISGLEAFPLSTEVDPSVLKQSYKGTSSSGKKASKHFKSKSMSFFSFMSTTSNEPSPKNEAWEFMDTG